jgi:hypothetical protein
VNDFEHLTDEELEAQIEETERDERRRRAEAREAEHVYRGKLSMWDITNARLHDERMELNRRKNNS